LISENVLILNAVARHDNDAFSALVRLHQDKIRSYLLRLSKSHDLADDIAQETFLTAFRKLQTYKGEGNFSGWLFRIAHNCFLQHIRKTKRRSEVTDQYGTELKLQAEQYDSISTAQMDLEQAMAQLNSDETSTISLCHTYGFSHQEVANILNMPLGSVKSNISRGKAKLKEILTKKPSIEESVE